VNAGFYDFAPHKSHCRTNAKQAKLASMIAENASEERAVMTRPSGQ
jgi:hypothetical protein